MAKKYVEIYDKNGNALLVDAATLKNWLQQGYTKTKPKPKERT